MNEIKQQEELQQLRREFADYIDTVYWALGSTDGDDIRAQLEEVTEKLRKEYPL